MDPRPRPLTENGRRDQIVLAGLQSCQQTIGALRLLGGALDDAAHQEELRIVAAMQFGVDGLHAGTPLVGNRIPLGAAPASLARRRKLPHQPADLAPGVTDMVIDMGGDAFGMPGFDRRKQRLVRPRDLMRIVVQAADQPDHHAQLGREIIEQPQQAPVIRDFEDQPVKAIVLFHLPRGIVEIGGLVQNIDLPPQHVARLSVVRFRAASTPAWRSMQRRKS